ncbi:MAG: hypothetical protein H0V44_03570 [Planctomycetes bacterium]|nr:hypothetical protein [Planctomycetota bacterium]
MKRRSLVILCRLACLTLAHTVVVLAAAAEVPPVQPAGPGDARAVFERRIKPIFSSPKPTSCLECHLAGVDLKNYIRPSSELTFRSLRDQGLVDLDQPDRSRILALISMGDEAKSPSLIRSDVRKAEYEAFAEWLRACCSDQALRATPKLPEKDLARPVRPDGVILHARKDQVLASFEDHVWSQRFRCMSCHSPAGDQATKLTAEQGDQDFLWIRPEGPEATMAYLIAQGMIDIKQPERSLLLTKPANQVKHAGGKKLEVGDQGYKELRTWIEDYARTVSDGYKKDKDLPPTATVALGMTDSWLKITNSPGGWGEKLLQVDLHAADGKGGWSRDPVATSDRVVFANGDWQHVLTRIAPAGSDLAKAWAKGEKPTLEPGKYLARVHIDANKKLQKDWRARLGPDDLVGETVIESSWPAGYGSMTVIQASLLKKSR